MGSDRTDGSATVGPARGTVRPSSHSTGRIAHVSDQAVRRLIGANDLEDRTFWHGLEPLGLLACLRPEIHRHRASWRPSPARRTGTGSAVTAKLAGIGVGTTVATAAAGGAAMAAAATAIGRSTRRGAASQVTPTTTNTARASPITAEGRWIGADSVALTECKRLLSCVTAIPITA